MVVLSDFPPLDVVPVGLGTGPAEKRSDPDDIQSMVRFLLYSNDLEIEGLVASAATVANVARKQNILSILELYSGVEKNLRRHDPRYPTAEELRSITWQGRDGTWGKPAAAVIGEGKDSEASDAILSIIEKPDPRPIWFLFWGGPSDFAQAIWKMKKLRSTAEFDERIGKLRVYMIGLGENPGQDGSGQWLLDEFPKLFTIVSRRNYMGMFWDIRGSDPKLADLGWLNRNIRVGHGPLGAIYPESGANPLSKGVIEGDSPSFLYLISAVRSINDCDQPEQIGWGGKFIRPDAAKNQWFDDPLGPESVWRWRAEVQKDFALRAKWMDEGAGQK